MITQLKLRVAAVSAAAVAIVSLAQVLPAQATVVTGWTPGTVFIGDAGNHTGTGHVYQVPPGGPPSIVNYGGVNDVAVDSSGNLYWPNCSNGTVWKQPAPGGGSLALVASGLLCPHSVAVDLAGNLLVADFYHIYSYPADGSARTLVLDGLSPESMAVDGNGDIYMSDGSGHIALMVGGAPPVIRIGGLTYDGTLNSVRLDSAGNIFASTSFLAVAMKFPVGGGAATSYGTGLHFTTGVAVDGAGNVYISDVHGITSSDVVEVSAGPTQTNIASGLDYPKGLAVTPPLTQTARTGTATTLSTTSPSTVTTLTNVSLTATVSGGSPGGQVQFSRYGQPLGAPVQVSGGVAAATMTLPKGPEAVTATYLGDASTAPSLAPTTLSFNVKTVATTTTVALATPGPTTVSQDQPQTFRATVTGHVGGPPTGYVTFRVNGFPVDTQALDGSGTALSTITLPAGTSQVTAAYGGDEIFSRTSSPPLAMTTTAPFISAVTTTTRYGSPNGPGDRKVTITVHVKGATGQANPTGTLTADHGFTCTALAPSSGISASSVCTHVVTNPTHETVHLSYGGDGTYDASSDDVQVVVDSDG